MSNFKYSSLFQFGNDDTDYEFISNEGITQKKLDNKNILFIEPSVIRNLTERAFSDVSHLLRPSHLKQLNNILIDKEASENDKFVALEMIKNANISAAGILPMCQDTGTAIVLGYKGENIFTGQDDAKNISEGIYNTYQTKNLRYSQVAPIDMFNEVNTNNNLPAQIEIYSSTGSEYKFAFVQKGGGSANKSFLYQKNKICFKP
jgi:fumarate hydratase class I